MMEFVSFVPLEELAVQGNPDGFIEYDLPGSEDTMEEEVIHNWELRTLREGMAQLPMHDQNFLYRVFSGDPLALQAMAGERGCSVDLLSRHKEELLDQLKSYFYRN